MVVKNHIINSTASSSCKCTAYCFFIFFFKCCSVLAVSKTIIVQKCYSTIYIKWRRNSVILRKCKVSISTLAAQNNVCRSDSLSCNYRNLRASCTSIYRCKFCSSNEHLRLSFFYKSVSISNGNNRNIISIT